MAEIDSTVASLNTMTISPVPIKGPRFCVVETEPESLDFIETRRYDTYQRTGDTTLTVQSWKTYFVVFDPDNSIDKCVAECAVGCFTCSAACIAKRTAECSKKGAARGTVGCTDACSVSCVKPLEPGADEESRKFARDAKCIANGALIGKPTCTDKCVKKCEAKCVVGRDMYIHSQEFAPHLFYPDSKGYMAPYQHEYVRIGSTLPEFCRQCPFYFDDDLTECGPIELLKTNPIVLGEKHVPIVNVNDESTLAPLKASCYIRYLIYMHRYREYAIYHDRQPKYHVRLNVHPSKRYTIERRLRKKQGQ